MSQQLMVGSAQVDITPPPGTPLAGSLKPRVSTGIDNSLYASAIVIESGGRRLAFVALDLISLERGFSGDEAVRQASEVTGIAEDHIC